MKKIALVLGLIALVASFPALAAKGDAILRFGGAYASPLGDLSFSEDDPPYAYEGKIEADAAIGPFVGFEYMFTDLIGLDATVIYTDHDVDSDYMEYFDDELVFSESETIGDVSFMPLFLSAHFHFLKDGPVDVYAGPTLGYVIYGDLKPRDFLEEDNLNIKNDFGYGAVVGLDVPFGSSSKWMFSTALRYIKTGAELDDPEVSGETLDIDPLILQVGVGVKF